MIHGPDNVVGDGDDRSLVATLTCQTLVEQGAVGAFDFPGRQGYLDQHGSDLQIASTGRATLSWHISIVCDAARGHVVWSENSLCRTWYTNVVHVHAL